MDVVISGIAFGESPRWHDDRVWYCDWVDGDVRSTDPTGTDVTTHVHVDGLPVCIDWDSENRLLVVDGSAKQLLRDTGRGLAIVADLSALSDRPWNEVVGHPSGGVYVNGIGFDMMAGEPPTTGQIALVDASGVARLVADDLAFPNGMVLTPDGGTLLVAESNASRITAYTVEAGGDLTNRRTFAEVPGSAPDGICVAADGSVWYADVPNRHCRRVAGGGAIIDTVTADRGCFSCALAPSGDLYITANVWDDETFSTRRGVLYRQLAQGPERGA